MDLVSILCVLAITLRVTHFVTSDFLFQRVRAWVIRKTGPESYASYFVKCPWCVSIWAALGATGAALLWSNQTWFQFIAVLLGASYATGYLESWLDD
jgi:uncharacterized membrane protein